MAKGGGWREEFGEGRKKDQEEMGKGLFFYWKSQNYSSLGEQEHTSVLLRDKWHLWTKMTQSLEGKASTDECPRFTKYIENDWGKKSFICNHYWGILFIIFMCFKSCVFYIPLQK